MFLSKLVLDPTDAKARRDLANPYEMHRTLSRAYAESPDHKPSRFLWRLEHSLNRAPDEGATILIQSANPGNWNHMTELTGYTRSIDPNKPVLLDKLVQTDRLYVFRLACNPTVFRTGKRYGLVHTDEQLTWLHRQGDQHSFTVESVRVSRSERVSFRKGQGNHRITLQVAQFDGILRVKDSNKLGLALTTGIGHAKALGLGMLSIAPLR